MQTANRKYRRGTSVISDKSLAISRLAAAHSFLGLFTSFLFILFLISYNSCFSQIINPYPTAVPVSEPRFSRAFIRDHKIKTIIASVVDKPDGEIIRDKGLAQVYAFDTAGNLTRHYFNEITSLEKTETDIPAVYRHGRVVKKASTKVNFQYEYDTLGTEFFYTSTGYLVMKRVCIGDFYNSTYFEYFGDGLVSRQTLCKETNIAKPGEPFKLGVQTILSEEKFEYENLTSNQVKKKCLNDEGKPYKMGILNFVNGKPVDESYQFVVGYIRSGVTYNYDSNGRLTEIVSTDNSSGYNTEKTAYEYDAAGNVKSEKKFKNGVQTNEIIYLYEAPASLLSDGKGLALLTSQANREIQKASIKIIKYEYTFY
jgi:antitoxin component YwqK of YwqJK toxin-antitoxin module